MNKDILKKAGRLLVAGFDGTEPANHCRIALQELHIGNWILFARNIESHSQVRELTRYLQRETLDLNGRNPFITIDQEGGIVSRLHGTLNSYPGAMACAAAGGSAVSGQAARITGAHLKALGFNVNLAPVADINSNPANPIVGPRSFGDSPEGVSEHVLAACRGYLQESILPVIKHFPGHGDSAEDSHLSLPTLPHSRDLLHKRELYPFKEAINHGIPAVMVAHLLLPSLSQQPLPASLSYDIITKLLRKEMGFNGLVMTDCLEMQGIQLGFETGEATLLALEAGADLCFISHSLEQQEAGLKAIYDGWSKGRISEARIDKSLVSQQGALNTIAAENPESTPFQLPLEIPVPEMQEISRRSLTLIRDRLFLPETGLMDSPELCIIYILRPEQFEGESNVAGGDPLKRIARAFPKAAYRELKADHIEEETAREPMDLEACRKLLIITSDTGFYPAAVSRIQQWSSRGIPTGVVVMRTPYEVAFYPAADFLLLSYEDTNLAAESVISLLKGEFKARGKCPVMIPGL